MSTTSILSEYTVCLEKMWTNRVKLECGHMFHKRCIETVLKQRASCPICSRVIFTKAETKAMRKGDITIIDSLDVDRLMFMLKKMVDSRKSKYIPLINAIISKHDPSTLLHDYITDGTKRSDRIEYAVGLLVKSRCINWHGTLNGQTLLEHAISIKNDAIFRLVFDANPMSPH